MNKGKVIIFSAPSGSGKSTIINYLMTKGLNLHFSISATSRPPRGREQHGVEYFFLSPEEFRQHITAGKFLEYEEVYKDRYYGTLKEQVDKQLKAGENVVCDVDVLGAVTSNITTVKKPSACSFSHRQSTLCGNGWKAEGKTLLKS